MLRNSADFHKVDELHGGRWLGVEAQLKPQASVPQHSTYILSFSSVNTRDPLVLNLALPVSPDVRKIRQAWVEVSDWRVAAG